VFGRAESPEVGLGSLTIGIYTASKKKKVDSNMEERPRAEDKNEKKILSGFSERGFSEHFSRYSDFRHIWSNFLECRQIFLDFLGFSMDFSHFFYTVYALWLTLHPPRLNNV
jgi:hypothetical protein